MSRKNNDGRDLISSPSTPDLASPLNKENMMTTRRSMTALPLLVLGLLTFARSGAVAYAEGSTQEPATAGAEQQIEIDVATAATAAAADLSTDADAPTTIDSSAIDVLRSLTTDAFNSEKTSFRVGETIRFKSVVRNNTPYNLRLRLAWQVQRYDRGHDWPTVQTIVDTYVTLGLGTTVYYTDLAAEASDAGEPWSFSTCAADECAFSEFVIAGAGGNSSSQVGSVTIYSGYNYSGASMTLGAGRHDVTGFGIHSAKFNGAYREGWKADIYGTTCGWAGSCSNIHDGTIWWDYSSYDQRTSGPHYLDLRVK